MADDGTPLKDIAHDLGTTTDAVRNKLKRLQQRTVAFENTTPSTPDEEFFAGIETPKDSFVGFRLAFYDIETTNLSALMGRVLCASIADSWGNVTTRTQYDFPMESPLDDSGVCEWLRDELAQYDIVLGWNSKMFDDSFVIARLLRWGKPIGRFLDWMKIDAMWKAKAGGGGARIGSAKLDNVAKYFKTGEQKTELNWETWQLAMAGDRVALSQVVEHCEADVLVLRSVFNHLKPLVRSVHR